MGNLGVEYCELVFPECDRDALPRLQTRYINGP